MTSEPSKEATSSAESLSLRLYNTLTRRKEIVEPAEPDHLRFYACGPTVYSYAHIGNFRSFLTADLIHRTARALGWQTTFVTNITDVGHLSEDDFADPAGEDKMVKALQSDEGRRFANVWELADYYEEAFLEDWHQLNLLEPYVRPRATQHMREQIVAVEQLVEKGLAYETDQGIYFSVDKFPEYGKLSGNREADQLEASGRNTVDDPEKRDPRDFALWKKDPDHLMQWYSPWGWGFPGWHIECSVMSTSYLGETFDLHTGGEDLIFPHHECEIAQSESITGEPMARYWVHTRFLQVEGEKMSKSENNFYTVRDLILPEDEGGRGIDPLALRYALISGHYRKQFNFTFDQLQASTKAVQRYRLVAATVEEALAEDHPGADQLGEPLDEIYRETLAAMADDLNTPEALARAYEGTKVILGQEPLSAASAQAASNWLGQINALLGIVHTENGDPGSTPDNEAFTRAVERLVEERSRARDNGDYVRADEIRRELDKMGVEVMDTPDGTRWRRQASVASS
jgi:cysteinyl-tRNA synthetase